MLDYITASVLGGTRKTWMDREPRHRIAFDPGEVWLGESRILSHQICYGEAALVYMWFVGITSMADPARRFNARLEAIHQEMNASTCIPRAADDRSDPPQGAGTAASPC